MSDDSEEKTLDPSEHKLRKAREKGQVANSQDFTTAAVTSAGLLYLAFSWPGVISSYDQVFTIAVTRMNGPADQIMSIAMLGTMQQIFTTVAPLFIIALIIGIVSNILYKGGIPFSMHPITPDFSKINPSQAFKKMFSKRNATEFGISLVRMIIWFAVCFGLIMWFLSPVLNTALCGNACILDQSYQFMILFLLAAIVLMLAAGLADLPIQTNLFRHEQRMGQNELKREMKETIGTPEYRSYRRREHQMIMQGSDGQSAIPTFILDGGTVVVGIRFDMKTTPVPMVVAKAEGMDARDLIKEYAAKGVSVVRDSDVSYELHRSVEIGEVIKQRHLQKVAMVMVNNGLL